MKEASWIVIYDKDKIEFECSNCHTRFGYMVKQCPNCQTLNFKVIDNSLNQEEKDDGIFRK